MRGLKELFLVGADELAFFDDDPAVYAAGMVLGL